MELLQQYKLNEIILQIQKTVIRFKKYINQLNQDVKKLHQKNDGKQILDIITESLGKKHQQIKNEFSEIINFSLVNSGDAKIGFNLNNYISFIKKNPDLVNNFIELPILQEINSIQDENRWITQSCLISIDTYINMFFKLIYETNNFKFPSDFNHHPKKEFYNKFPEFNGCLDFEFKHYQDLHSIRNNAIHNGLIVDKKLNTKLDLNTENNQNDFEVYIPDFKKTIFYAMVCTNMIFVISEKLFKDVNLKIIFTNEPIIKDLENYINEKNKFSSK